MKLNKIYQGDVLAVLKTWPDEIVDCVVTSPPYWGLRDYGIEGQLGLEPTLDEYLDKLTAVFREVRRVLKPHGTAWVNMGDAYASAPAGNFKEGMPKPGDGGQYRSNKPKMQYGNLKPKDLTGQPWLLARALQTPYYIGKIKSEIDRAWLAAIIDGEGTITANAHLRKDDGRWRTRCDVFVTNTSAAMLDECCRIWPASRRRHNAGGARKGRYSDKPCSRWWPEHSEKTSLLLSELYPYFIVKKKQCLLGWNLLEFVKDGRRLGKSQAAQEVRDKRRLLVRLIQDCNHEKMVVFSI